MFDNARDANQYLANTVCYWRGQPVYVESVGPTFIAQGYVLPVTNGSVRIEFDVRAREFNCREFKLGYMNSETYGTTFFVSRRPVRGVAQGLCDNNLSWVGVVEARQGRMRLTNAIRDKGFADMLLGVYPERNIVNEKLQKAAAVAVSPWLSIKKHQTLTNLRFLEYRGREISYSETLEFDLPEEFQYLKEICGPVGVLKAA